MLRAWSPNENLASLPTRCVPRLPQPDTITAPVSLDLANLEPHTTNELKGIFARLSDRGDTVNQKMASTFKVLSELADFSGVPPPPKEVPVPPDGQKQTGKEIQETLSKAPTEFVMHHDVHIHLPISTDIAVYDAIFLSIREHLT